ncbi:TadE/TadG family type IV pilus assembly protein [Sphingomicrobium aestuariivivum]|uniref:TadE/TadG family type IV pilus assembly protein n=1 Tax=Sphingomicrobium aestuariivivum TaxID=1582356 RepID=UPI001FD677C9|nr:TadE/TadG family type IV pilus assembly protein [Sphingomicrobium aestuariivivum]MCJ8191042.1 pilus assembly protein [Sphingomicrobium aestuariivivum]
MSRLAPFRALMGDRRGGSAAEFALILPILLIFIFGIIDAGRFMWAQNQQEKALQAAVRYAVVTDPVAGGLETYEFAIDPSTPVGQGDPVPASYWSSSVCTDASCSCSGSECGGIGISHDPTAYEEIAKMICFYYKDDDITSCPDNANWTMTVRYDNVGLGFSGDPNGSDIVPLVTVSLTGLQFTPLFFQLFRLGSIPMHDQSAALTGEDLVGTVSN